MDSNTNFSETEGVLTVEKLREMKKKLDGVSNSFGHGPDGFSFGGAKIHTVPSMVRVKRSIWERLFSFPWRPLQKEMLVPNMAAPEKGSVMLLRDFGAVFVRNDDMHLFKNLTKYG